MKRFGKITSLSGCVFLLFLHTACAQDMYYVPAKQVSYSSRLADDNAVSTIWDDDSDAQSSAQYSSSYRVSKERYRDPNILGNLHFKSSENPQEESVNFTIRKNQRGYSAETPIGPSLDIAGHKVTPNFALGIYKDHKAMAGITFRIPF